MPKDTRLDANTEFIPAAQHEIVSDVLRSHKVLRGTLKGNATPIVCKEINNPALAQLEILAQEFFRLIIAHQPETYLAVDKTTGVHYIISQEIPGYTKLPVGQAAKFKEDGGFTGLGLVCLVALFLQESDLKNGNLGLNNKNQVMKIDGDWCFAAERRPGIYKISPEGIASLPFPKDFNAYNWLDLIRQGVANPASAIVSNDLSQSPKFRAEVNQAMLKICLLPNAFIEQFVDAYISAGGQRFVTLIKERQEELRNSALKNASFVNYLATPAATTEVTNLIAHMKGFKANRTELVSNLADLEDKVKAQMQSLQSAIQQAKTLISEISVITAQFRAIAVIGQNKVLDNYLEITALKLSSCGHDPVQLLSLKSDLAKKLPLAKDANALLQSKTLTDETDALVKKIRTIVPIKQDKNLDTYLDAQEKQLKGAWLDPAALNKIKNEINTRLIAEVIKATTEVINKIELVTKKKDGTTNSLNEIKQVGTNLIELEKILSFHLELYSIYKAEDLVKENEQLVDKIKAYIISDMDTELVNFLENALRDNNEFDQEPNELELIKKSLQDKLSAMPGLLKSDCQSLLQDIKEDVNLDEQYNERLKTNDPQALLGIKLELTVELSSLLKAETIRQLDEIRQILPAPQDISLFIKDAQTQIDRIGNNPEALKTLLTEVHDKHREILDASKKLNTFHAMKENIQVLRENQTKDLAAVTAAAPSMKERLAQIKANAPTAEEPNAAIPADSLTLTNSS